MIRCHNLHKEHPRERNKLLLKVQRPKQVLCTQGTKRPVCLQHGQL